MENFNWSPALDVKNDFLNDEHKELISRMNLIAEKNRISMSKETLLTMYDGLITRTSKHFADEEIYLESIGYPGIAQHARIHKQLIDSLASYRNDFVTSINGRFPNAVFDFFKTWITTHILIVDKEYVKYVDQKAGGVLKAGHGIR